MTEQGLADVRGMCPRDRAPVIIEKCAHPDYRDILMEYYERSLHECLKRGAGHEPHMLRNAFKMHEVRRRGAVWDRVLICRAEPAVGWDDEDQELGPVEPAKWTCSIVFLSNRSF